MSDKRQFRLTGRAVVLMSLLVSFAFAQGPRNGTTAASQLLIPQGAQHLSGGGATASATGIEAVFWNPAGLARTDAKVSAIFSRRSYIADMGINYFGAGLKFGKFGSLGASVRAFDVGEIKETDIFNPDGTGGSFSPVLFVLGTTYSNLLSDRTSVGLSLNFLNESWAGVRASAMTMDVGIQYASFLEIENLNIGVALKNFGTPMKYSGSALLTAAVVEGSERKTEWYEVSAAAFDMPFVMDIGANYTLPMPVGTLNLGVTFENNFSAQDEYRLFGEYSFSNMLSARFAMLSSSSIEDDPKTDANEEDLENIFASYSFGGSLSLEPLLGYGLFIDYAFIPTKFFSDNQIFSIRLEL